MSAKDCDKLITYATNTGLVCAECRETICSRLARLESALSGLTEELPDMKEQQLSTIRPRENSHAIVPCQSASSVTLVGGNNVDILEHNAVKALTERHNK
jgi:hypothetical protein